MPNTPHTTLDALFSAFRESEFLNVPLWEAKKFGLTEASLRQLAENSGELEIVRIMAKRPFEAVRAAFSAVALARVAPVPLERLRRGYARDGDGKRRLEALLAEGADAGLFHVAGGQVLPGPGESEAVELAPADAPALPAPPVDDPEPLQDGDLRVLSYLEDIEEQRINFGLYDTFVSLDEILVAVQAANPRLPVDAVAVHSSIERLRQNRLVLVVGDGRYRSRISETVRVLKRVKQRFRTDDAGTAPYLIHSIRVHFEDRQRLARNGFLRDALRRVFERNQAGDSRVDAARKAIGGGISASWGRPLEDLRVTAVQERATEFIAGRYLAQQGQGVVITGNTGSGKTEAALFPLLLGAVEEKLRGVRGCKMLLVYPRQELAKNQLQRLCEYLARINEVLEGGEIRGGPGAVLTAGIVFGETPMDDADLVNGSRYRKKWRPEGNGYTLPYFTDAADGAVLMTALDAGLGVLESRPAGMPHKEWTLEGFRATRTAVLADPPDVLVITTEMLHRWLMNPDANRLFGLPAPGKRAVEFAPPRAIVFDEIHLYDTIHGAQIGLLLRRLRERLGTALRGDRADRWEYPLVIGMSATIGTPRRFWAQLSGLPEPLVEEFSPDPTRDLEAAQGREYFLFIRPETYSRGRPVGDAAAAIQSIMAVAHNMVRRGPEGDQAPKHRSLVFQDSISKIKKLALEFTDAESNRFLPALRLRRPDDGAAARAALAEGDYWVLDAEDPYQFGERRTKPGDSPGSLTSDHTPIYSGARGADRLKRDIIFSTSVLEVGYDDPSIQFVLQHHAPRNAASFVQKKGRAGRALQDRPITAVTLSRNSFRDAFYYQNPHLLYNPADYRPPLNVENYFVQHFQSVALLFDELTRITGVDLTRLPRKGSRETLRTRLGEIEDALDQHEVVLNRAFERVTAESFRRVHPTLRDVWKRFRGGFKDREVRSGVRRTRSLLRGHPGLPENLFSTLNLPTLRVMYRDHRKHEEGKWRFQEEDVALAFWENAPGKVTRRYGRGHALYWRAPGSFKPWRSSVAIERYKEDRKPEPGPFNSERIRSIPAHWGPSWASLLPANVHRVYNNLAPDRFYRARFLELWSFGTIDPNNPKKPQPDWRWWGRLQPDGSVRLQMADKGTEMPDPWRRVSPDSTSYPLSCAVGGPLQRDGADAPSSASMEVPPLFPGVLDQLCFYAGEQDGQRSAIFVWEVHYGAEARVILVPDQRGKKDPHAGTGANLVRYESEQDHKPLLYGYDLTTEGVRVPFGEARLEAVATELFDTLWAEDDSRRHLQDQYLRFLLKSERWPLDGVNPAVNAFDLRTVADLVSTMRAETRAQGENDPSAFLDRLTTEATLAPLVDEMRRLYWPDRRVLNDGFVERLTASLTHPPVRGFLKKIFSQIGTRKAVEAYLQGVVLHSLKHAVRHLFITEGSTRDEEVGSFGMFRRLTHDDWSATRDFYIYERNQDGSGATRLVAAVEGELGIAHLVRRWWDLSLACPVGDEEDFFRAALNAHADALRDFAARFLAAEPDQRESPRDFLAQRYPDVLDEDALLLERLAGVITSEFKLAGEDGIPMVDLYLELNQLEAELATRFGRLPTPGELAGYAASAVAGDPHQVPRLTELRALYRRHDAELNAHDPEGATHELDRFLDQVQHLSLRTCVDACPACLASECHLGHIDTMRHALSRRRLKDTHRILSAPFTVTYHPGLQIADLEQAASTHGGWVILVYHGMLPAPLVSGLRDRFDSVARIFDHERIELRRILRRRNT